MLSLVPNSKLFNYSIHFHFLTICITLMCLFFFFSFFQVLFPLFPKLSRRRRRRFSHRKTSSPHIFFLKNHIIQHNLLHPCMYYMWKTHGMWSVMWLPLTVSRWQNALRDKRRSITGAVWHSEGQHALQVRAAQLSFKDIAVASLSHPILSLPRMKLRPPLEKQIQPYYRARIYSTALSESISFKWLCCVWGISVEF